MTYKLDLELSLKKFTRGGIELYLNWRDRNDGHGCEPAYVFTSVKDWRRQAIMTLSEIHAYVESSGFPIALAIVSKSVEIAEHLGFSRLDRHAAKIVADMMLDYVEDLKNMPSEPPASHKTIAGQMAELSIQMDGQTVMETEVAV